MADIEYSRIIAEHIANTNYEDLPENAKEFAKKSIMDTLGIMFPATTMAATSDLVHDLMTDLDEGASCTLIGYGEKSSLLNAAFVNGSQTHAVDFDDSGGIDRPLIHPSGSGFPAAITLAEYLGSTGEELITAMALANDVGLRVANTVNGNILWDYDFFSITTLGVFCATTAACKLLKLNADQTLDALGLAVNRFGGIRDSLFNCEFRSIRDAFANQEGIRCAYLASRGFSGCKTPLEDLFRVVYGNNVTMENLIGGLGEEYLGATVVAYKMWPSCQGTQAYATAALRILEEHPEIALDQIESVTVRGIQANYDMVYPKEIKARPKTSITAKVSIPYVVGRIMLQHDLQLEDFELEKLEDPEVLALADLVEFEFDPAQNSNSASATMVLKDGTKYDMQCDYPRGAVQDPVSLEQLINKFKGNAKFSKFPMAPEAVDELAAKLLNLEKVQNIKEEIMCYLS